MTETDLHKLLPILRDVLAPLGATTLECDGSSRVVHYVLSQCGVPHVVKAGSVKRTDCAMGIPLHFWIELDGNHIIDYKLRYWMRDFPNVPHGVFKKPTESIRYESEQFVYGWDNIPPAIINILSRGLAEDLVEALRSRLEAEAITL